MKTYILAVMLLAAVGMLGYMMGEHSAAEDYRLIVEEATKQREAERDSLLKENQDAWAKEAEYRKALDTANAQEYGDCASSHDTAVNLYQAARK